MFGQWFFQITNALTFRQNVAEKEQKPNNKKNKTHAVKITSHFTSVRAIAHAWRNIHFIIIQISILPQFSDRRLSTSSLCIRVSERDELVK